MYNKYLCTIVSVLYFINLGEISALTLFDNNNYALKLVHQYDRLKAVTMEMEKLYKL